MHIKYLFCALLAFSPLQSAIAEEASPTTLATPAGTKQAEAEPPADPEKVADTELRLRDHARKIYAMMLKEPEMERKIALNQMMTDCGFMIRFMNKPGLKYSVAQKEEKKLTAMLQDGVLDSKEMAEWHKDMLTKVGTGGREATLFNGINHR